MSVWSPLAFPELYENAGQQKPPVVGTVVSELLEGYTAPAGSNVDIGVSVVAVQVTVPTPSIQLGAPRPNTVEILPQIGVRPPWDVRSYRHRYNWFDYTVSSSPYGLQWSADGSKFYTINRNTDELLMFRVPRLFDLDSINDGLNDWAAEASVVVLSTLNALNAGPGGFHFSEDGLHLAVMDTDDNVVYEYDLATAWEITDLTYSGNSFSFATQDTNVEGVFYSPDGSKLYACGQTNGDIFQYALSPAFDVSSATYGGLFANISPQAANIAGLWFKPDGTKMWVTSSAGTIFQYTLGTAWNVSTATYDSVSKDMSAYEPAPNSIMFSPDGTTFHMAGNQPIRQFPVSTAWDISTATEARQWVSLSNALDTAPQVIAFKPDGTKCYVYGSSSDDIFQYTLSTPWDLRTMTYDTVSFALPQTAYSGLNFNPSGERMYLANDTNNTVDQYDLGTAWNVSTAVFQTSKSVSAQLTNLAGGWMTPDGAHYYLVGSSNTVYHYTLSIPFDLTTMTFAESQAVAGGIVTAGHPTLSPDGKKLFVLDISTDAMCQYSLSTAFVVTGASIDVARAAETNLSIDLVNSHTFSPDGKYLFYVGDLTSSGSGSSDGIQRFDLWVDEPGIGVGIGPSLLAIAPAVPGGSPSIPQTVTPSVVPIVTAVNAPVIDLGVVPAVVPIAPTVEAPTIVTGTADTDVFPDTVPIVTAVYTPTITASGAPAPAAIVIRTLVSPKFWNADAITYTSRSTDISGQETEVNGLWFAPDGLTLYVVGNTNKTVYQYTLTIPWDASTGTYASKSLVVSTEDTQPVGLALSSDGTKLYIMGYVNNTVYQYTLSTPWDVSTGTYASISKDATAQSAAFEGLTFRDDGLKMYLIDRANRKVFEYTLGTAWNVSTATYIASSPATLDDTYPSGVAFKPDGLTFFYSGYGQDKIYEYSLSVAWDITTATNTGRFKSIASEGYAKDVFVDPSGRRTYTASNQGDKVFEYVGYAPPTITATATVQPASFAPVVVINAPTLVASAAPAPNAVAVITVVGFVDIIASATVTPSVVAVAVTTPTPTITASVTASPAVVAITPVVPAPTITASAIVRPPGSGALPDGCTPVLAWEQFNNFTDNGWAVSSATIVTGRNGDGARTDANGSAISYTIPSADESEYVTVGFAWRTDFLGADNRVVYFLGDAGATTHMRVLIVGGGEIYLYRGTSGFLGNSTGAGLLLNTWHYIEVQVRLHDTLGFITVRVDGVDKLTVSGVDTKNGGTDTVLDTVSLRGTSGALQIFDDLYISTGSTCQFQGDPILPPGGAAVAVSAVIPAPTVAASATVAPTVVAIAPAVPAPTITTSATVEPAVVSVAPTVEAPTINAGSSATATPAVVAIAPAIGAPTITASATVQPASVAIAPVIQAPTITASATVQPASVAIAPVVQAPTITASGTASPAVVPIAPAVGAPTITASATVTPATTLHEINFDGTLEMDTWPVGSSGNWSVQTTGGTEGTSNFYRTSAATHTAALDTGFTWSRGTNSRLTCWVRLSSSAGNNIMGPAFGPSTGDLRYVAMVDPRVGRPAIQIRTNATAGTGIADSVENSAPFGRWLFVAVDWASDGTITATLYDSDGVTQIAQVSVVDSTHTSGVVGSHGYADGQSDIDQIRIETTTAARITPVIHAPTITASTTVQPASVAITPAVPTPTITASATVQPAVVPIAPTVEAPTIDAGSSATATPSVVAIAPAVGAPTTTASATVQPASVAIAPVVNAPGVSIGVSPSTVAITPAIGAPTITASAVTAPSVVAVTTTVGAPVITATATATPLTVAVAVALGAPTITASATVSPATVSITPAVNTAGVAITVRPAVVPITPAVGAPTITASATVATATVAIAPTIGAPTITTTATTTPAVVPIAVAVGAPTIRASATVTATTVPIVVAIGAPTVSISRAATPAVVPIAVAVGAPTITASAAVAPAVVPIAPAVNGGTAQTDSTTTVNPAVVAITPAVGAPTITASATITVATVAIGPAVGAPTITTSATVATAVVAITPAIPTPTITATGRATPSTVPIAVAVGAPTITASATVTTTTVPITPAVGAPNVTTGTTPSPATVAVVTVVGAPTVTASATLSPGVVAVTPSVGAPAITVGVFVSPATVAVAVAVTSPTITASGQASPATVVASVAVGAPTVSVSTTVTATTVPITVTIGAVTIGIVTLVSPATVAIAPSVPQGTPVGDGLTPPIVIWPPVPGAATNAAPNTVAITVVIPAPSIGVVTGLPGGLDLELLCGDVLLEVKTAQVQLELLSARVILSMKEETP